MHRFLCDLSSPSSPPRSLQRVLAHHSSLITYRSRLFGVVIDSLLNFVARDKPSRPQSSVGLLFTYASWNLCCPSRSSCRTGFVLRFSGGSCSKLAQARKA